MVLSEWLMALFLLAGFINRMGDIALDYGLSSKRSRVDHNRVEFGCQRIVWKLFCAPPEDKSRCTAAPPMGGATVQHPINGAGRSTYSSVSQHLPLSPHLPQGLWLP